MRKLVIALVVLCWAGLFATVWSKPDTYQFDFKSYYCAAKAYELGRSPYDVANLRLAGGNPHLLGFYYPLSVLHLLRPVCRLEYDTAHRVWVVLKAFAALALLLVWKRAFLKNASWLVLLVAGLLCFGAATVWDIKSGNITLFEQLFLWTGFACLLRSRMNAFVICIVLASAAKLLLAVFLLLLFLPSLRSRVNTLRFAAGALAMAVVTLAPFAAHPDYLPGFIHGLTGQHPSLRFNPSILGLVDEFGAYPRAAFLATGWPRWLLVAGYYVLLFFASRPLRWAVRSGSLRFAILVGAMFYALLVPRLIIYSCMIAIVPALALLLPAAGRTKIGEIAVLTALCISGLMILPSDSGQFISDAIPFLLLWGAWMALVSMEKSGQLAEAS
jgi:hypothetical protein